MTEEVCGICHKPRDYHDPSKVRHAFNVEGQLVIAENRADKSPLDPSRQPQGSNGKSLPSDPILRLALIRLGIIQPSDLQKIEDELRVSGVAYADAQPRTGGPNNLVGQTEQPIGNVRDLHPTGAGNYTQEHLTFS